MVDISQHEIDSEGYVPESYELIPKGKYRMAATGSELKDTNDGTGKYVNFEFQVTEEGPYLGRKLWKLCMIQTVKTEDGPKKGVKMGINFITELALACGIRAPGDTEELHGIEVIGDVVIKKPSPKQIKLGFEDSKNEIRGVSSADSDDDAAAPVADEVGETPWKQD